MSKRHSIIQVGSKNDRRGMSKSITDSDEVNSWTDGDTIVLCLKDRNDGHQMQVRMPLETIVEALGSIRASVYWDAFGDQGAVVACDLRDKLRKLAEANVNGQ